MRARRSGALRVAALSALAGHALLIAFSTAAMLTVLNTPQGSWLQSEPGATVMRIAWRYSGQSYVVLGALAGVLHAAWAFGWRRALGLSGCAAALALGAELVGTSTGFPFGPYEYTELLGYRVLGLVPYAIPISWFYMIYSGLVMGTRFLPARDDSRTKWIWAAAAACMLTAWDVAMDPAMVATGHWVWREPGAFYGMPLSNWIGWLAVGALIARAMITVVPPSEFAARTSGARLPVALYALNGVMPVAICMRDGLWGAAALGSAAMAAPILLALSADARRRRPD
ncbi:MAG: carotenoid biosynthesis protein, partial [Gemmatimonadaceae bacterium]